MVRRGSSRRSRRTGLRTGTISTVRRASRYHKEERMQRVFVNVVLGVFTGRVFRAIENGEYGSFLSRVYAATKGRKTTTAAIMAILTAAATQFAPGLVPALATVTVVLGHAGLVDKGSRADAPEIDEQVRNVLQTVLGFVSAVSYAATIAQQVLGQIPGCAQCTVIAVNLGILLPIIGTVTSWLTAYLDQAKRRVF